MNENDQIDGWLWLARVVGTWHLCGIPDPALVSRAWQWDAKSGRPIAYVPADLARNLCSTDPGLYALHVEAVTAAPIVPDVEAVPQPVRRRKGAA